MKYLLLLALLPAQALAVKFTKQEASPLGVFTQGFELSAKTATYVRTSNAFDSKEDYRIGTFSGNSGKARAFREKLEALVVKIATVDQYLRKSEGTSFNEVAGAPGHRRVFVLDGFMIPSESKHAAELESIFSDLKALSWKHVNGYELSPDLTKVTEYVSGKVKRTVEYTKDTYCDRGTAICTYSGGGKLLLKKGNL